MLDEPIAIRLQDSSHIPEMWQGNMKAQEREKKRDKKDNAVETLMR